MPLGLQFAEELSSTLRLRRMKQGLQLLAGAEAEIGKLGPRTPDAARLLFLIAQWMLKSLVAYDSLGPADIRGLFRRLGHGTGPILDCIRPDAALLHHKVDPDF